MAKLTEEQQKTLDDLKALAEAPDEPAANGHQRVENINYTIDLDNEVQVKRAVKAGLLPASYLDDDDEEEGGEEDEKEEPPRRRARFE